MVSFGPSHFFRSSLTRKTFPCGLDEDFNDIYFFRAASWLSFSHLCSKALKNSREVGDQQLY